MDESVLGKSSIVSSFFEVFVVGAFFFTSNKVGPGWSEVIPLVGGSLRSFTGAGFSRRSKFSVDRPNLPIPLALGDNCRDKEFLTFASSIFVVIGNLLPSGILSIDRHVIIMYVPFPKCSISLLKCNVFCLFFCSSYLKEW